jgi:clan AA aspartic protease (TIGR02281 family)
MAWDRVLVSRFNFFHILWYLFVFLSLWQSVMTLRNIVRYIALVALVAFLPLAAQAQLVKCVRADGSTAYQDSACPVGANSKAIAAVQSSPSAPEVRMTADAYGHFHALLSINNVTVDGLIDTGATKVSMSVATARAMNISGQGGTLGISATANGSMYTYNTIVNILKVGNIELYNVAVSIGQNTPTLIGMSALSHFIITQENGQMILVKR